MPNPETGSEVLSFGRQEEEARNVTKSKNKFKQVVFVLF